MAIGRRWIRLAFRLLYNELAGTYDAVSWLVSLGGWRQWQMAALPYLDLPAAAPGRVLELAHGPGHMLLALEKLGHVAVGLDLSPAMGRLAARRLRRHGSAASLVRSRAEAIPFAASSFDAVLATFPTEFIVHPDTLDAVWRVLRPGGALVIVPQAQLRGSDLASRALEKLYAVTGQRSVAGPSVIMGPALAAAGFAPTFHAVPLRRSLVTVVRAPKLA